jgi:RNA polymerase sigma factor (sigma-70 family)
MPNSTGPQESTEPQSHSGEPKRSDKLRKGAQSHHKASHIVDTFLLWESSIKRFLSRFLYRPEDVDELAQETFLSAYDTCERSDIQSPKAYLFRVAKNMALKELNRKSSRLTEYLEDAVAVDESVLDGAGSVEDELIAQQKIAMYCEAIATFPPQCRKVFLMRKVHAHSHREIAQALNISVSAVEKHVSLGVAKFDAYLQEHGSYSAGVKPRELS